MYSDEFEENYTQILHTLLKAFANSSEVEPEKFFDLASVIEKLRDASPVLYDAIKSLEDEQSKAA
ncbi:hypothetical protein [Pontibacter sp. BAB1700]|uniref:hypothetical protein n=1 Tax=Pontibacter sp. BAB1700 TaxID=1144253 RepID=UPI00026BCA2E|nr:hypothetical protein [Pontibacter sp. BAB1700]EJF07983.1 hypothetical protein O71_23611 [Pontibacter sp. BAB1700]